MSKTHVTRAAASSDNPSTDSWLAVPALLWPAVAAATAADLQAAFTEGLAHMAAGWAPPGEHAEPEWATPNHVALELSSMRLRAFAAERAGRPALICAPFALHHANVADFAVGHSLVAAVQQAGRPRVFVTDWRTASPDMRFFGIDSYLADMNVAIDELAPPVDIIGLCQGGWLALLYAARFPGKVRRLALAGAPVDLRAGTSALSGLASSVPLSLYKNFVTLGNGRMPGRRLLQLWEPWRPDADAVRQVLQLSEELPLEQVNKLLTRFFAWYERTVDLPGTYYLQVVEWLFKQNRIVEGQFVALGRCIDLAALKVPLFLLAAGGDELVPPAQMFALERHVGTPTRDLNKVVAPGGHLGLFMGAKTLGDIWPKVVHWLGEDHRVVIANAQARR